MQSTMPFRDLLTVMSTIDLLSRNAVYAPFVQRQVQQALSLANTHNTVSLLYDSLLSVIAAAGNMTEASVPQ